MKVAIIGSRNIKLQLEVIGQHLPKECIEIISGGSRGVDSAAYLFSKSRRIPFRCFLPDYHTFGQMAPLVRNQQIIKAADFVLAFWNGYSKGTQFVIKKCTQELKSFKVIRC
ncbi:MAG: DNA-protecting protein DprA [Oscillospiraceae bacterium]|jgi:hypothetical protein|nr:DNA-protecting protein DprA [Oscillospiraceae bacterium]